MATSVDQGRAGQAVEAEAVVDTVSIGDRFTVSTGLVNNRSEREGNTRSRARGFKDRTGVLSCPPAPTPSLAPATPPRGGGRPARI